MLDKLKTIVYPPTNIVNITYTAPDPLKYAKRNVFNISNGDRPNFPNILVFLTDTYIANTTKQYSDSLNISSHVIGIGNSTTLGDLNHLVADPHRIIIREKLNAMSLNSMLHNLLCNGKV